jgi:hypothetical protein
MEFPCTLLIRDYKEFGITSLVRAKINEKQTKIDEPTRGT